jgi:hypothetical protein
LPIYYRDAAVVIPFSSGTIWQPTLSGSFTNAIVAGAGLKTTDALDLGGAAAADGSPSTGELTRMGGWKYTVDLSSYRKMRVTAKKMVNHGIMYMGVDLPTTGSVIRDSAAGIRNYVHYNSYPTTWTTYELDVSSYSGSHIIYLLGGWFDNSGNTGSQSRYCNLELI